MKFADIKGKSKQDLQSLLIEKREALRELRAKRSSGQLKQVRTIRLTKKAIARILTVLKAQA